MSNSNRGVLFLYEWFEAMESLSPKEYKTMMNAIFRYQLYGEEPPEFKGKTALLSRIIFPYIGRRIMATRAARIGALKRTGEQNSRSELDKLLQG